MSVMILNYYYDVNDPGSPIKDRALTEYTAKGSYTIGSLVSIFMKRNQYQVNDSWLQIFGITKGYFYSMKGSLFSTYSLTDGTSLHYPAFSIIPDINLEEFETYQTNVITFLDVIGLIGGAFK